MQNEEKTEKNDTQPRDNGGRVPPGGFSAGFW